MTRITKKRRKLSSLTSEHDIIDKDVLSNINIEETDGNSLKNKANRLSVNVLETTLSSKEKKKNHVDNDEDFCQYIDDLLL